MGIQEEVLWRSILVVAVRRRWAWYVTAALVLGTSVGFGYQHLEYGTWNMVSAGLGALAAAFVTISSRSLWPAILGHALYDLYAYMQLLS